MLYHIVAKVLMLFIIYMLIYMIFTYGRIQIYELNLAENIESELKIIARQEGNDILQNQLTYAGSYFKLMDQLTNM